MAFSQFYRRAAEKGTSHWPRPFSDDSNLSNVNTRPLRLAGENSHEFRYALHVANGRNSFIFLSPLAVALATHRLALRLRQPRT
jgi:hypothetical protein